MAALTASPDLKAIVASTDQIASLPDVAARIIQAAEDPRSNAFQIIKIVTQDPALVTRLLQVVNSSYYSVPTQVTSVERAITLLGLITVKDLAVASSVSGIFRGKDLCEGFGPRDLWVHSIAVAICARELARGMKLPMADEGYLVGMVHDIGLLVMHQKFPDKLREICRKVLATGRNICELERETLGFDHAQLGAAVAERWKFAPAVRDAIEFHHDPASAPAEHRALASLIHVADTICCHAKEGFYLTGQGQELNDEMLTAVPVTRDVVGKTQQELKNLVTMMAPFAG